MKVVPTFKTGQPGHAARLNDLGDAVRELQEQVQALQKPAPRKRAAAKKAEVEPEVGG